MEQKEEKEEEAKKKQKQNRSQLNSVSVYKTRLLINFKLLFGRIRSTK